MLFKIQSTADIIEKQDVKQMYSTILSLLERRGFDLQPHNRGAVTGYFRRAKIVLSGYPPLGAFHFLGKPRVHRTSPKVGDG